MKKVVIFGVSNFSAVMRKYLKKYSEAEFVGYTLNQKYMDGVTFDDSPVFPFEELDKVFSTDDICILLTVGYGAMNNVREQIYHEIKAKGYELMNFIHPTAIVDCEQMGDANIFLENVILAPGSKIGSGNICFGNVHIAHGCVLKDFNFLCGNSLLGGDAALEDHCFIGMNSVVGSSRTMAPYTFVAAGVFINVNSEPYGVYVGERVKKLDKNSMDMTKYLGRPH